MKQIFYFLLIPIMAGCMAKSKTNEKTMDYQVMDLMSKMSVEEKVGQMTQVTLGTVMNDDNELDLDKLRFAILEKNVGSILNVNGDPYSVEEWHKLLTAIQDIAKESNNQIPILYGIDAIHGTTYTKESTLFPHNIGMAATRNPELVKQGAKITALETRASGIRWNFDPTLGIGRQPLWPRFEETYGEDVHLLNTMAEAVIRGYEEDGVDGTMGVASCMKHYLGYSVPQSGKDRTPAYIPDTQLREYFLPAFETAVAAGTSTVMINSGEINGIPVHGSEYYLKDILRGELGFEGLAVSDWEDIIRLHTRHKIADSPREAVKVGVNAGIDMSMVPTDYSFYDHLVDLVNAGEVSIERIDEAVYRILKLKKDLGLFDNPYPEDQATSNFGKAEYKDAALDAARESITLLKNETDILPLKKNKKVLLTGPAANNLSSLHSSWSYTWQGNNEDAYPSSTLSIKEAIENKIGADNVICNAGRGFGDINNFDVNFLRSNASKVDYIILALGEKAYAESPGIISDLTLDANQIALAKAAIKTGKPVVLLLAEGRPRVISDIESGMDGILLLYRPGSQGANATADILFGDYNPNGRLPYSYHRSTGDIVMYDHKFSEAIREPAPGKFDYTGYNPQWAFGHGLSYTTFEYSNLKLNKEAFSGDESLTVSIEVKNTGKRDGKVAVELYVSDLFASITPANKRLKKYQKIDLVKGASQTVTFELNANDLSFIDAKGKRVTEAGEFTVAIEGNTKNFTFK